MAVTFAPIDFANAIPCLRAFFESSEPSVGIKMCLYIAFSFFAPGSRSQVIAGFSVDPGLGHFQRVAFLNCFKIADGAGEQLMVLGTPLLPRHASNGNPAIR